MQIEVGVGFADFLVQNVQAFLGFDLEIHDHVKTHGAVFKVYVKAVELQCPGVSLHNFQYIAADFGSFVVLGVVRLISNASQDYAGFF